MSNIYFIDFTTNIRYDEMQDKPIGGSEFQFYNLLYNVSKHKNIICYNKIENKCQSENILYKNVNEIHTDKFETNDIIVIQRLFPDINILQKFNNCKIIITIQDYDFNAVLFQFQNVRYNKIDILNYIVNNNIHFVFNSEFTQKYFNVNFTLNNMVIDKTRQNIIYNMLYTKYFVKGNKREINKKHLVYASGWNKGIFKIIEIFDYILSQDSSFKLLLMSPGYEYKNYINYEMYLRNKYPNNIIIYGPVDKLQYCKIIENSGCVLAPSFFETFGCVFAECYYLGKPVICDIKSGAVKEIIGKENVVNYNNVNEVYNKIISKIELNEKIELNNKFLFDYNFNLWKNLLLL